MGNVTAAKTISIFSIIYGVLNFFSNLKESTILGQSYNPIGVLLSIALVVIAIVSLTKISNNQKVKGLVIAMLVFWLFLLIASILFLGIPVFGWVVFVIGIGLSVVPIISGFKYLSSLNSANNKNNEDITKKLTKSKSLYDGGYITEEEYEEIRKKILDENI